MAAYVSSRVMNRPIHRIGLLILSVALSLVIQACSDSTQGELKVGLRAPAFTLPSTSGGEVSLSDYEGTKPVLLYFHMAVG